MTSEVLIMNNECVVLAADSAATVESNHSTKIFTTDKVFRLSDNQPLGIMTYGNADITGVPVSILVMSYRDQLGDRVFRSVRECAEDFLSFLSRGGASYEGGTPLITEEHMGIQAERMVYGLWGELLGSVLERLNEEFVADALDGGEVTGVSFRDALRRYMVESVSEKRESVMGIADMAAMDVNRDGLREAIASRGIRPDSYNYPFAFEDFEDDILDIPAAMMSSEECGDEFSGLVFAGYGTDDHFPAFSEYRVTGLFYSGLGYHDEGTVAIDAKIDSWVEAFAQRDVVDSYLSGMSEDLRSEIVSAVSDLLDEATNTIMKASGMESMRESVRDDNERLMKRFIDDMDEYTLHNYTMPVENTICFLSKDEVAVLAESLIKFTSLRRRVSEDYETVGGPVDLAVISKHEGFVWIKRKQYFTRDLNPQYRNGRR